MIMIRFLLIPKNFNLIFYSENFKVRILINEVFLQTDKYFQLSGSDNLYCNSVVSV